MTIFSTTYSLSLCSSFAFLISQLFSSLLRLRCVFLFFFLSFCFYYFVHSFLYLIFVYFFAFSSSLFSQKQNIKQKYCNFMLRKAIFSVHSAPCVYILQCFWFTNGSNEAKRSSVRLYRYSTCAHNIGKELKRKTKLKIAFILSFGRENHRCAPFSLYQLALFPRTFVMVQLYCKLPNILNKDIKKYPPVNW